MAAGRGGPLAQRSDPLAVQSRFQETIVGKQKFLEAADDQFRECAENDASSAELSVQPSRRLTETSAIHLTEEGRRKVRDLAPSFAHNSTCAHHIMATDNLRTAVGMRQNHRPTVAEIQDSKGPQGPRE